MFSFLKDVFSTRTLSLLIPDTILVFSSYILAAYWWAGADPTVFLLYDNGLVQIALVVVGVLAGLQFNKLYVQVGVRSKLLLAQQLCLTLGVTFLMESALTYLHNPGLVLPPPVLLYGSALTLATLLVWRMFYSALLWRSGGAKRVLFYGMSPAALEAGRSLQRNSEFGLSVTGYIETDGTVEQSPNPLPVLGSSRDLARVVAEAKPDRIVLAVNEPRQGLPFRDLLDFQFRGIEIQRVAELYETACERICTAELVPSQLIFSDELEPRRAAIALQAVYSNIVALAGLALLAILILPLALSIKLSSPGPVLMTYDRLGLNMVPFQIRRFRCRRADGRSTMVGRFLRRLRLDGLPQFLNLIRGEMSLIGPRPHRPEFIRVLMEQMPYYAQRHAVRPGILGWSQLNYSYGRKVHDAREALEYDLYYIKHASPALDAYIILHSLIGGASS